MIRTTLSLMGNIYQFLLKGTNLKIDVHDKIRCSVYYYYIQV